MNINKKISEFISVDGFDNTTQIPIVQGSPMFNGKITPEKFAEALGIIAGGDLDKKVDKVEGKSLILDTEIARLANVTNQTRASLNIDEMVTLTEDEYDNLSPKDPNTYYFIKEY